jgi:hypothetical protein
MSAAEEGVISVFRIDPVYKFCSLFLFCSILFVSLLVCLFEN